MINIVINVCYSSKKEMLLVINTFIIRFVIRSMKRAEAE